ncbi:hypothetical protein [Microbacterium trichothecenolyticum]|uniref:Uncharacterized protein n=1 Tax=Microbacterium trichothecenolyticum TaxID=69370 RepID=A0ABU0TTW6_MICTR|nr:hypothetical protein [Microbacterium trichothecenolyticum]MDQ1123103.1 hypothetical protein [Microbacterium trichothecenolyticum]
MSIIAVAAHARRPTMLVRVLLLTALIIAGLLAMHALNTHGTAAGHGGAILHGTAVSPHAASTHGAHAGHAAGAAASVSAHEDHRVMSAAMADVVVPSTDHAMAWMACVLALLGAVILFVVAVGRRLPGARAQQLSSMRTRWSVLAHTLPPPSLALLCIRRT